MCRLTFCDGLVGLRAGGCVEHSGEISMKKVCAGNAFFLFPSSTKTQTQASGQLLVAVFV